MNEPRPVQTLEYASPQTDARPLTACVVYGSFELVIAAMAAWFALAFRDTDLLALSGGVAAVAAVILGIVLIDWRRGRRRAAVVLTCIMIVISVAPIVLGALAMSEARMGGWLAGVVMLIGLFFVVIGVVLLALHLALLKYLHKANVVARLGRRDV